MHRWVGVNPYHPKLDCLRGGTKIPVLQPWTAVLVYLQNAIKHVNVGNVWKHTLQDYSLPTEWWAVKTCNSSWEAKSYNHQRTLSYFESSHNANYQLSWSWFRNTNSCQLVFPTNTIYGLTHVGSSKELSLEIVKRSSICWVPSLQMWRVQHCQFIFQCKLRPETVGC